MENQFIVTVDVACGQVRDDLYKGRCNRCGKALYEGDTIYKSDFGKFCVDCFFEDVVHDLLAVA